MKHSRATLVKAPASEVFPDLVPPERDGSPLYPVAALAGMPVRPRAQPGKGHIRATAVSFASIAQNGTLVADYLAARKVTFVDRLGWDLPQADGLEFDQYDTPLCRWVIVHEFGEILGGVRLLPTKARVALYSYMLRDAQRGILENIPTDVLFFDAPVQPHIWEASRLFVAEDVPAERRPDVHRILMRSMSKVASAHGARYVIGIVPAVFSRWLRRLGMDATPVGPKFSIDGTSSQAALFSVTDYIN